MWHLGGVFYSFNVKTKIPPLSTFVYDVITINQIRKTQNVSQIPKMLESMGSRVLVWRTQHFSRDLFFSPYA